MQDVCLEYSPNVFAQETTSNRKFNREANMTGAVRLATLSRIVQFTLVATGLVLATSTAFAAPCASLANFQRPNTTITIAQTVPAGTFVTPTNQQITGLPEFCRVAGYTTPTSDSHISFEVWIPQSAWNLKYLQAGCGGFCGSISYGAMAEPLRRGYAVAATDDGHQASGLDASWAVGHPEKVIDYGYRAVKETTDVAKAIVLQFESNSPRRSYFMGCSDGGREGLMAAQRFPRDFDGIIAGSPGNDWTGLMAGFLWDENALTATSAGDLTQADLNALSNAVLAQCVGHDGGLSSDTFLTDPPACRFNVAKLLCNESNSAACLTADKLQAVRKISSGPSGIFPGYRAGLGEANVASNWPTWLTDSGNPASGVQARLANTFYENIVFPNSGWTPSVHSVAENYIKSQAEVGAIVNSVDPNLQPFKSNGGKLIQYVGWSDTGITPQNDIDYLDSVTKAVGGSHETSEFYRLFMVPGMSHCSGGPGANAFGQSLNGPNPTDPTDDILSALNRWVEDRVAPDQIIATKYVNDSPAQGIAFQRPLCPYPKVAKYNGTGNSTSAASFVCPSVDE
jgi:tannase/feruloyl esterase